MSQPDAGTQIYACGPQGLLDGLATCCAAWPEDALRVEHFHSTLGTLDPSKEQPFEVVLKDSGIVINVPADQTLLTALRGANIDVQSDCEEGLCGSCEVRVLEGNIDHRDVVLTRAERDANNKMMACCSRSCGGGKVVLEL
ncbi:Toluene-4-sulfonate monooxygenase system reductase subunit TsaB1 [compost metagenome]